MSAARRLPQCTGSELQAGVYSSEIRREGCLQKRRRVPLPLQVDNCLAGAGLRCLAPGHRWYLSLVTDLREGKTMGIGTSIFLIALGAILRFAVTATVSGIEIATVGTILLVVGIIGLLISLLYTTIWADRTRAAPVDRGVAPTEREVVRDRY